MEDDDLDDLEGVELEPGSLTFSIDTEPSRLAWALIWLFQVRDKDVPLPQAVADAIHWAHQNA